MAIEHLLNNDAASGPAPDSGGKQERDHGPEDHRHLWGDGFDTQAAGIAASSGDNGGDRGGSDRRFRPPCQTKPSSSRVAAGPNYSRSPVAASGPFASGRCGSLMMGFGVTPGGAGGSNLDAGGPAGGSQNEGIEHEIANYGNASSRPVFSLRNVSKLYDTDVPYLALDRVNLDIRKGEFLCLLGASGCGKSTLLNLLAGFEASSSGSLLYHGKPVRSPDKSRVMFFQNASSALLPWQTVRENVEFGLRLQGIGAAERQARAEECLQLVGLSDHCGKYPGEISGGMQQRLQIARALAVNPDVFLMDEPFAALDAFTRRRMHRALIELWNRTGKTIVFVTHDLMEAIVLADRIAIMNVGPASNIKRIFDVGLPSPRDPGDPAIGVLFREIENFLDTALAAGGSQ
jgi:NitT/TauT family transport system ATP-binding protein